MNGTLISPFGTPVHELCKLGDAELWTALAEKGSTAAVHKATDVNLTLTCADVQSLAPGARGVARGAVDWYWRVLQRAASRRGARAGPRTLFLAADVLEAWERARGEIDAVRARLPADLRAGGACDRVVVPHAAPGGAWSLAVLTVAGTSVTVAHCDPAAVFDARVPQALAGLLSAATTAAAAGDATLASRLCFSVRARPLPVATSSASGIAVLWAARSIFFGAPEGETIPEGAEASVRAHLARELLSDSLLAVDETTVSHELPPPLCGTCRAPASSAGKDGAEGAEKSPEEQERRRARVREVVRDEKDRSEWREALQAAGDALWTREREGARTHEVRCSDIASLLPGAGTGTGTPSGEAVRFYLWMLQRTATASRAWGKALVLDLDRPETLPREGMLSPDSYDLLFFPFVAGAAATPEGVPLRPAFTFIAVHPHVRCAGGERLALFFDAHARWTRAHATRVAEKLAALDIASGKPREDLMFYCWTVPGSKRPDSKQEAQSPQKQQPLSDADSIVLAMLYALSVFANTPPPSSTTAVSGSALEEDRFRLVRALVLNKLADLTPATTTEEEQGKKEKEHKEEEEYNLTKACMEDKRMETFVVGDGAEQGEAEPPLPRRLECPATLTTQPTPVQSYGPATPRFLERALAGVLEQSGSARARALRGLRGRAPIAVRTYRRYLALLMREALEFGNRRYGARVWVDLPEVRTVTAALDLYALYDFLLFPFEDAARTGHCTLVVADLGALAARGVVTLLHVDALGVCAREDVSTVVRLIRCDRENKGLPPCVARIVPTRCADPALAAAPGDSAAFCMFCAHNLLLPLAQGRAADPTLFSAATLPIFRAHMADELESGTITPFFPDGLQPVTLNPYTKKPMPVEDVHVKAPEVKAPEVKAQETAPAKSTSPAAQPQQQPQRAMPEGEQYEAQYAALEKLWASQSFGELQAKLQAMLLRAPGQLLHSRATLLNGQPCAGTAAAALVARDVLELVPGNVVTERTAVWYCALVQDAARTHPAWRQATVLLSPDAFSRWRARKDAAETLRALGPADALAPGTVLALPVRESVHRWALLLAVPARSTDGAATDVSLLFVDPHGAFSPMVRADATALLQACFAARGGAGALTVSHKNVPLPAPAADPAPGDSAVAVLALIRAVVAREKLGLPRRLIPAFRLHAIREMLKNSLLPMN